MSEPAWVPLGALQAGDPGVEVAYQEFTSSLTVTAATEAAAQTVVTAPAFTADGISTYLVEFFSPGVAPSGTSSGEVTIPLFLDGVSLGVIGYVKGNSANPSTFPVRASRRITPAAGSRVFSIRAYTGVSGAVVNGGVGGGTGIYVPGYIRVSKIPSGVQIPTWSPQPVAVVTALPASPVDGQEIILVDSLTAPTYSWHLKFIAAKASNKWVAVGGEAVSAVPAQEARGTPATYADLGTLGPQVTVPVAGIYTIEIAAMDINNGGWGSYMSYAIGATAAVDADAIPFPGTGWIGARFDQKTLAAGTLLQAKYRSDGSHTATFRNRIMRVTPTAVGG